MLMFDFTIRSYVDPVKAMSIVYFLTFMNIIIPVWIVYIISLAGTLFGRIFRRMKTTGESFVDACRSDDY